MNECSEAIARWLEQKRRIDRGWAIVTCVLAFGSGAAAFLLTNVLIYTLVHILSGAFIHSALLSGIFAFGLTSWSYARIMQSRRHRLELDLDPLGLWIIKDLYSIGPRLLLEGLRQARCSAQLGKLNVSACAQALTYLAAKHSAVTRDELLKHCPQLPWKHLREQLLLLNGVLFLGEDGLRVTLMAPFRLFLSSMLPPQPQTEGRVREPGGPRAEPASHAVPVNEPEKLSAYELLGLPPSASFAEIRTAYRKRIKACHPDLFAGMDEQARALAERWTKALNAAYATLNPRQRGARPRSTREG
jgi:hypothetical protein